MQFLTALLQSHPFNAESVWLMNESRSVMSNSVTLWTGACQAPLSMEFSRQEYWRVANLFSRRSSQPRDQTGVSCIASGFFTSWATREAPVWLIPGLLVLSLNATPSRKSSLIHSPKTGLVLPMLPQYPILTLMMILTTLYNNLLLTKFFLSLHWICYVFLLFFCVCFFFFLFG